MIIQLANILGGVLIAAPFISRTFAHRSVDDILKRFSLYEAEIGIGVLVIGILALIERLGIFFFGIHLGSSFPQALPAIAIGIVLGYPLMKQLDILTSLYTALERHKTIIGLIGIAAGLGSLVFGCISPVGCPGGVL